MQSTSNAKISTKNIDYVIQGCLTDIGDFSTTRYTQFLHWGLEAYRELNLYDYPSIKVAYLQLNENFTVNLPDDYVYYTSVGVCVGGTVITLGLVDNLCLPRREDECGEPLSVLQMSVSGEDTTFLDGTTGIFYPDAGFNWFYSPHFRGGQYVGEQFGVGGGFALAYYRVDLEKRQIAFSSSLPANEVVLEYKSTGINMDGSATIPVQAVQVLKQYIHWCRIRYDNRTPQSAKMNAYDLYQDYITKFRALELSFTMDEYLDAAYSTFTMIGKR